MEVLNLIYLLFFALEALLCLILGIIFCIRRPPVLNALMLLFMAARTLVMMLPTVVFLISIRIAPPLDMTVYGIVSAVSNVLYYVLIAVMIGIAILSRVRYGGGQAAVVSAGLLGVVLLSSFLWYFIFIRIVLSFGMDVVLANNGLFLMKELVCLSGGILFLFGVKRVRRGKGE